MVVSASSTNDRGTFRKPGRVGRWLKRKAAKYDGWMALLERGGGLIASTSRYAGVAPLRGRRSWGAAAQVPRDAWPLCVKLVVSQFTISRKQRNVNQPRVHDGRDSRVCL